MKKGKLSKCISVLLACVIFLSIGVNVIAAENSNMKSSAFSPVDEVTQDQSTTENINLPDKEPKINMTVDNNTRSRMQLRSQLTTERYTVLVLDTSASSDFLDSSGNVFYTADTAIDYVKASAKKFIEAVQAADGTNYVAVVEYKGTEANIVSPFSSDLASLSSSIDKLQATGGTRNLAAGLQLAEQLIDQVENPDAIKNTVLFTTGMTNEGDYSYEGHYDENTVASNWQRTDTGVRLYAYSNVAYSAAESLKNKASLYSIGLFQTMQEMPDAGKEIVQFFKLFASEIATSLDYFYDVKDPNDLEFVFGEVADDITQDQMKNIYVDQHKAYYNGDYKNEVQEIELPVENSETRRNTNIILGNIILDAAEDKVSRNYNIASVITDGLNLNFDFVDGAVDNYELILADIVTSSYYKDVLKEAFSVSAMDDALQLMQDAYDFGSDHLEELAANSQVTTDELRLEWQTLASTLDQMKVCDDPGEYASLFGKCSIVVDKYIKAEEQTNFLNSLAGTSKFKENVLGAAVGASVDTLSEIMTYYSCYDAYCYASDTYKDILVLIAYYAGLAVQTDSEGNPIYNGGTDEVFYKTSLFVAVQNFLSNATDEATGADAIAEKFAKAGWDNIESNFAETFVDEFLDLIPIVKDLNRLREAAGLTSAGTMFLVDCATKIDDRAYAASIVYHLYYLTNCVAMVTDHCGGELIREENAEKAFDWAYRFDEAVRVWRCCSLMICDTGLEFETYCLQDSQKHIRPWLNSAMEDASWYSTAISMAALEKELITDIHCHDVNLSYDPSLGRIDWSQNAQVVLISCPVWIQVTDENGTERAVLKDDSQTISPGYESYFHVQETTPGSNDYMKICFIPANWNITFTGTGNGSMYVLKADIVNGKIQNPIESPEISILKETKGHLTDDSESFVIVDNIGISSVIFDANGGKLSGSSEIKTDVDGKLSSWPDAPTRNGGFVFTGWFTEPTDGSMISEDYTFTADTTVYAQWEKTKDSDNKDKDTSLKESDVSSKDNQGVSNSNKTNSKVDSEKTTKASPVTGDTSNVGLWLIILLLSIVVITIAIINKKRINKKSDD